MPINTSVKLLFNLQCQMTAIMAKTLMAIEGITDSEIKLSMQHVISDMAGSKSGLFEKAGSILARSSKCDLAQ